MLIFGHQTVQARLARMGAHAQTIQPFIAARVHMDIRILGAKLLLTPAVLTRMTALLMQIALSQQVTRAQQSMSCTVCVCVRAVGNFGIGDSMLLTHLTLGGPQRLVPAAAGGAFHAAIPPTKQQRGDASQEITDVRSHWRPIRIKD